MGEVKEENSSSRTVNLRTSELLLTASLGLKDYQAVLEELTLERQYTLTFFGKIKGYLTLYYEDRTPYIHQLEQKREHIQHRIHAIVVELLNLAPNVSDQEFREIKQFLNSLNDPVLNERIVSVEQYRMKRT